MLVKQEEVLAPAVVGVTASGFSNKCLRLAIAVAQ